MWQPLRALAVPAVPSLCPEPPLAVPRGFSSAPGQGSCGQHKQQTQAAIGSSTPGRGSGCWAGDSRWVGHSPGRGQDYNYISRGA